MCVCVCVVSCRKETDVFHYLLSNESSFFANELLPLGSPFIIAVADDVSLSFQASLLMILLLCSKRSSRARVNKGKTLRQNRKLKVGTFFFLLLLLLVNKQRKKTQRTWRRMMSLAAKTNAVVSIVTKAKWNPNQSPVRNKKRINTIIQDFVDR